MIEVDFESKNYQTRIDLDNNVVVPNSTIWLVNNFYAIVELQQQFSYFLNPCPSLI